MTTVALRTVAVVALLVLAGCSSGFGSDRPDRDPYGVDDPVDVSTGDSERVLPGLTNDELEDVNELREAHRGVLGNRSYRVYTRTDYTSENGSTSYALEQQEHIDYGSRKFYVHSEERGAYPGIRRPATADDLDENRTIELWIDRDHHLQRTEFENGTVSYDDEIRSSLTSGESRIFRTLHSIEESSVGSATIEGDEYYLIQGKSNDQYWHGTTNQSVSATVYVHESGLVRHYRLEGDILVDGEELRVREEVTLYDGGETSVEPPGWYEEAIDDRSSGTGEGGTDEEETDEEGTDDRNDDDRNDDDRNDDDQGGSSTNSSASIGRNVPMSVTIPIA